MGDGGPENLNLVEPDQPIDRKEPDANGPRRPYHRIRFRPPQGLMGHEPEFFEGQGGELNQWRGVGTDNQGDTGSPASVNLASAWSRRRAPEPEITMPNAVKESDPQEEGQGQEKNQEFYDMQQR